MSRFSTVFLFELKGYLKNKVVIGVTLFLILAGNIIGLVIYVRRSAKKEPVKVNDLTEEQKEALRQELLNDLKNEKEE